MELTLTANAETLATLEAEIDAMITQRILLYHQSLIDNGQIHPVELKGPTSHPVSHCIPSEHKHSDGPPEGLAPLHGAHSPQIETAHTLHRLSVAVQMSSALLFSALKMHGVVTPHI